jgi:3-hydroxy-3-methylglutaryl CoA synthase
VSRSDVGPHDPLRVGQIGDVTNASESIEDRYEAARTALFELLGAPAEADAADRRAAMHRALDDLDAARDEFYRTKLGCPPKERAQ